MVIAISRNTASRRRAPPHECCEDCRGGRGEHEPPAETRVPCEEGRQRGRTMSRDERVDPPVDAAGHAGVREQGQGKEAEERRDEDCGRRQKAPMYRSTCGLPAVSSRHR